jgi:glycosyltransferase involved in cell wall biosynthesis
VFQAQSDFDDTMRNLATSSMHCAVFVVDDGSSPPLEIRQYGSILDIRLVRFETNQGIVAALNAGLEQAIACGFEYIARMDAGDFASKDRLARQIDYLERHPLCMLVGSDAEVRDETGSYCFTIEPPRDPQLLAEALHERAWLLHPGVMYRTSVLRDLGLYVDTYPAAEDYEMLLRIASRHEVGVVAEPLLTYILRKSSISGRNARRQALSRLRAQLRYFRGTCWKSYYGVIQTIGTLLVPNALKQTLKTKFLYSCKESRPDRQQSFK